MKTFVTESHLEAARIIKNGGIVAFPTETVYGLGADIFNEKAIEKIFTAKGRPADNPLIAHIGHTDLIKTLATNINSTAKAFMEEFFPGPLTLILEKRDSVPEIATAGLDTLGVRMPENAAALEFLGACENPLVAPSANLSGKPSPTTWKAAYEDLNGKIECILKGEATEIGLESTVLDCTDDIPFVLRKGAISIEQLQTVNPKTQAYESDSNETPKSPGLKHKHYSPKASVMIFSDAEYAKIENDTSAYIGINKPKQAFAEMRICNTVEDYARDLYSFFRFCDEKRMKKIYCEEVNEKSIGAALMDRIRRASE